MSRPPTSRNCWPLRVAAVDGDRTPRVEPASGRRIGRVGRIRAPGLRLGQGLGQIRHSRPQRARVGVHRAGQDAGRLALLDHLAEVEDGHLLAKLLDNCEVVRDQEVGERVLVPQPRDQLEHPRLHRHVERACRLVEDEHARLDRERPRDRDPLALAARELMGEAPGVLGVEPNIAQKVGDACRRAGAVDGAVRPEGLGDRSADPHPRVEGRVGILEDDLDALAVGPELPPACAEGVHPVHRHARPTRGRSAARSRARWSSCPSRFRRPGRGRLGPPARSATRRPPPRRAHSERPGRAPQASASSPCAQARHSPQQLARVRVPGLAQRSRDRALLDHPPSRMTATRVAQARDDGQVVADEERGDALLGPRAPGALRGSRPGR